MKFQIKIQKIFAVILCVVFSSTLGWPQDWPTWRYDAGRTAAAPEALTLPLHPQWIRRLPPAQPAWPASQYKLQFDVCSEPVAANGMLYVPSNGTDSVTAYDLSSGEERWRFYAEGPIRFAPVARDGKIWLVSDDSWLYCLRASNGALLWKFCGGPSNKKIIGNHRLISAWPARGAPVLVDDTLYFAASIWPFMGIFYYALDANTGRVLWTNSGTGSEWRQQPHGGAVSFSNLVPQGYLAAAGENLVIPGGRSTPGVMDRVTGRLRHFVWPQFGGGGAAFAQGAYYYNAGGMRSVADGSQITKVDAAVITEEAIISTRFDKDTKTTTLIFTVPQPATREIEKTDRRGKTYLAEESFLAQSWEIDVPDVPSRLFFKAGGQYFLGGPGQVACVEVNEQRQAKVAWNSRIDGEPGTMLAADGRLIVVLLDGTIHCFGPTRKPAPKTFDLVGSPPRSESSKWRNQAESIFTQTNVRDGYCLVLGAGTGRLAESIVEQSNMNVIVLDPFCDVAALRRRWSDRGLYGRRLSILQGDTLSVRMPPYLANLIVSEDLTAARFNSDDFLQTMYETLRPYGGIACFEIADPDARREFDRRVRAANLAGARLAWAGEMALLSRDGALPGSADWTHHYGDSANSVVSRDTRVKLPLGLLWFGGPSNDKILPRHGHGPSPQVVEGRLFIEGPDLLRAVDVYTGRLLWEKELEGIGTYYDFTHHQPGAGEIGSNYVSLEDGLYVAYGDAILRLDPATGDTVQRFHLPSEDGSAPNWGYIGAWQDLLVTSSSPLSIQPPEDEFSVDRELELRGLRAIVEPDDPWRYLAGSHPPEAWTRSDFDVSQWNSGPPGFGFGDRDDQTVLSDMRGKYQVIYIRKTFDREAVGETSELGLMIDYDDAFIVYLNGVEVLRVGVGKGRGDDAEGILEHEAQGLEYFPIENHRLHLRDGVNSLAIEGHNAYIDSSDLSLNPVLTAKTDKKKEKTVQPLEAIRGVSVNARYGPFSKQLVVLDRHSGKVLWTRRAAYSFRHNTIIAAAGKVFCIDALTPEALDYLRRRGYENPSTPTLYALDARTGRIQWKTTENVFGTWLGYSNEYGVLVQAGSANADRARDEAKKGIVVYQGDDGKVVWQNLQLEYQGPLMLHHDHIITNGFRGWSMRLLTGESTGWTWRRAYGCNHAIAGEHLMTFRSGAAGYCDLTGDSGTGNLGGFKSGCTSNLIAAGGVLSAPDYTRTCACAYQNQTSLALLHDPEQEVWTIGGTAQSDSLGINFGAPGNRRGPGGTLWLDFPNVGGDAEPAPVSLEPPQPETLRYHASRILDGPLEWVAASAIAGVTRAQATLATPGRYTVRLVFAELENRPAGERIFDVAIQGKPALDGFDVARAAGGAYRTVTKEFKSVEVDHLLTIDFAPRHPGRAEALICGIEILREKESKSK